MSNFDDPFKKIDPNTFRKIIKKGGVFDATADLVERLKAELSEDEIKRLKELEDEQGKILGESPKPGEESKWLERHKFLTEEIWRILNKREPDKPVG